MRPTVHAPDTPLYLRIEFNPVRGVHPFLRHPTRGTNPGLPAIFAAEKTNICRGDELPMVIKRIEVVAISVRYIKTRADPSVFARFSRVNCDPTCTSVRRAHGSSQIRPVTYIGVLLRHCQRKWVFAPIRSKSFCDPRVVYICGGLSARIAVLFPNRSPMPSPICGLGNSKPFDSTFFQISIGDISDLRIMQAGCDRSHSAAPLTQAGLSPSCPFVIRRVGRFVADNINEGLAILLESRREISESLC